MNKLEKNYIWHVNDHKILCVVQKKSILATTHGEEIGSPVFVSVVIDTPQRQ